MITRIQEKIENRTGGYIHSNYTHIILPFSDIMNHSNNSMQNLLNDFEGNSDSSQLDGFFSEKTQGKLRISTKRSRENNVVCQFNCTDNGNILVTAVCNNFSKHSKSHQLALFGQQQECHNHDDIIHIIIKVDAMLAMKGKKYFL